MRPLPIILALSLAANLALAGYLLSDAGLRTRVGAQVEQVAALERQLGALRQENAALRAELQALKAPAPNPAPGGSEDTSQDKTVLSWYFHRNKEHRPPTTDPAYLQAIAGGRGIFLGPTDRKRVYLTFDEGYENSYTARILDILAANDVQAAFFVTGPYVRANPGLVRRMAAEGHVVGNHSQTHPSLPKVSNDLIREEVLSVHRQVRELTGTEMRFFRPPMGEFNRRTLDQVHSLGYTSVFWSMAYKDWDVKNQPGSEAAYRHVIDNVHPGAVILLHAVSESNTEALDRILKELKRQGYTFGTLHELA